MDAVRNAWRRIRERADGQRLPVVTASLLSIGVGTALLGRRRGSEDASGCLARMRDRIRGFFGENVHSVPILPPQSQRRPVLVFDATDLVARRKFSVLSLDFLVSKRAFADVFLFHTAHLYELIHVSESSSEFNRLLLHRLDPYGCISYKVFCEDKKRLTGRHLNRPLEKVVALSTREGEYHSDLSENTLRINRWKGDAENGLLDLVNFFYNLHFVGAEDFRGTIRSYFGKDFYPTFSRVQKSIFVNRNLFCWDVERRYRERIDEINRKRMEDFEGARTVMDAGLKTEEKWSVLGYAFELAVKCLF